MTSSGFHAEAASPTNSTAADPKEKLPNRIDAEQRPQGQDPEEQDQRFLDQQVDTHGPTIGRAPGRAGPRWSSM